MNQFNPFLKNPPQSLEEYKAQCIPLSYEDLVHETEKYRGTKVHLSGQVVQVMGTGPRVMLFVNITKGAQGLHRDTVLVNFHLRPGTKKIPEESVVDLWGEVKGKRTYTTALGRKVIMPEIDAVAIEVLHHL